jgi:uncharacterized protein YfaS (alpha-2-macroglobulin family)
LLFLGEDFMHHRQYRFVLGGVLLVGLLVAGLVGGPLLVQAGPPQQQNTGTAPRVIDTDPVAGEEVPLDATITFYFDQPMDMDSVEAAFSVDPAYAGRFAAPDDRTLQYTPDKPFERARAYTFTIGADAQSADGVPLEGDFTLTVQTVGYLTVSEVLPADGTTLVATDSAITAIFNRPVVPLVTVEDMADLPEPLVIEPAVDGAGEWLNTSIYIFRPERLAGGTTYTVTVPDGLKDVTGGVLDEDFVWSFTTNPPTIVEINPPRNEGAVALDTGITVRFNQAMDPGSVEEAFAFVEQTAGAVPGTFDWSEDGKRVVFTPEEMLPLGGFFSVMVDATVARGANGITPLDQTLAWNFTTVGPPAIDYTEPGDGALVRPSGGFSIYFETPMDRETLPDKVIVEPEPAREYDTYYYQYNNRFGLSFPLEPDTAYTVTILPGMADVYGNTIDEQTVVRFTTDSYYPDINLTTPGRVGVYSAYAPQTRLFSTYLNINQLDLQLYQVGLEQVGLLTGPDSYDFWRNFSPPGADLLRRWTVPVEYEANERRFQLLTITGEGESTVVACPGAPEPQLQVGGVATVITEPDPLRVRESAPDGEILELIYSDYQLPVVSGPTCANGYYWWQVELRDGTLGWVAEGDASEYYVAMSDVTVEAPPDTPVVTEAVATEALPPGAYYLEVSSPATLADQDEPNRHLMIVATANVTLKFANDSALAWVTDMETGLPVEGAPVTFYDSYFMPVAEAFTDADGLAMASIPRLDNLYIYLYAVVNSPEAFGFAVSEWTWGIEPYDFDLNANYYPQDLTVYLYTDRPIYRPGQPVYFRGVARSRDDVTYTPPPFATIPIQIRDHRGEVISEQTLPLTEYGTFNGEFDLAEDAGLGYYELIAVLDDSDDSYYSSRNFRLSFGVAEYRAPEFQVTVTPEADAVVQGDTIRVMVDGEYFFGGAVSNSRVSYTVLAQNYYFSYAGRDRYDFSDYNYDDGPRSTYAGGYGEIVAEDVSTTDDAGQFMIELPADLGDATQSQRYVIEASITDESDQLVAGRSEVIVHQGEVYVGVRPERYVGLAGEENTVQLIAVDWDSEGVPDQDITVEVVERRWSSVQEEDDYGRTVWTWEVEEIPVEDAVGTVTSGADGTATFTFVPPVAGTYKAYVTTRDDLGNEVRASTFMWVSGRQYVSWRQQNSNRIDLITDRDSYAVGDTAEVLIASPWQGTATALITIERGDILSQEVITLESNSTVYRFPIEDDYAPNVFVSVMLVKGVDENTPVAEFRLGMAQLAVDPGRREIQVTVTPDREQAGPRETVTYTVLTTDYTGEPVSAEVGVGLTDLAVLTIADPNSGPLMSYFYGRQGLGVRTAVPLTISVDQLTQTTLDTVKGGGGGGGGGGIFEVRQEFVDTPYWNPVVVTGADGTATFDVTLPDNLTTWRLDARAVTDGSDGITLVGQTEVDLLSTKPMLMRPITPRFFVVGDTLSLVSVVNNNTDEAMTVEATLEGAGVTFHSDETLTAEIPASGRHRFEWAVTVEDVQAVDLTFYASGDDGAYTDASKPPLGQGDDRLLPVYRYEVPETVGTGGMLAEAGTRTEAIALPRRFDVTQGELTVRVDPSLAATTIDGLDYLANYPYQCTEQTVSRFLPNVMTYRALDSLGVADDELRADLDREVSFGLQRLYAQQKADGGWGWFVNDNSSALTTAYALIGLAEARNSGYDVSPEVIDRAVGFLNGTLIVVDESTSTWRLNRQAFVLYALARADRGNVSRTMILFDYRERLSEYATAYLAVSLNRMALVMQNEVDTLVASLTSEAIVSATGAHWEEDYTDWWNWNTDTRTTATVLGALIELDPENALLQQAVRWLMVSRSADHWETTQETAWALMALTDWMVLTGELEPDYRMLASLNGDSLLDEQATPANVRETYELRVAVADLLADAPNVLELTHGEGPGAMYYTAHLRAFLPVPEVEPLNRGIIVDRRYSLVDDDDRTPIDSAPVGTNVRVTLTIIAPNNLHYVVIEDPIPAGTDAVDPNLNTSEQIGTRPEVDRTDPLSYGWGWWYFSNTEFRDEKVVIFAEYLPAGTYEYSYTIRTGLAGEFNVIPTTGQEFYFPEVYGRSAGTLFTITPAADES